MKKIRFWLVFLLIDLVLIAWFDPQFYVTLFHLVVHLVALPQVHR